MCQSPYGENGRAGGVFDQNNSNIYLDDDLL